MKKRPIILINIILCAALLAILVPFASRGATPASASTDGVLSASKDAIVITEVMSSNECAVPDENGNFYDYVELYNSSDSPVNLSNYFLTDDVSKPGKQQLAGITIPAKSYAVVYCSGLTRTGHASFKLSAGETVALFSAASERLDSVLIEEMPSNSVMSRGVDGSWTISQQYTPGLANTPENHAAYLESFEAIGSTTVYINEVISRNVTTFIMEDGSAPDWVELYNAGTADVNIGGWSLTDDEKDLDAFTFSAGTILKAGDYILVICDGEDLPGYSPPHAEFSISSGGETITLYNEKRQAVDRLVVPYLDSDTSIGRNADDLNKLEIFLQPTPLLPNNAAGARAMTQKMLEANNSGLLITEAMSSNKGSLLVDGATPDWLELTNISGSPVNLEGYGLSDSVKRLGVYIFSSYVLEPGKSIVIYADTELKNKDNPSAGQFYAGFNIGASGNILTLTSPEGAVLDKYAVPALRSDISYGRAAADGSLFYYFDQPTPGQPNGAQGYAGIAEIPQPSALSGVYNGVASVPVSFDAEGGTVLYYTTDGSVPTKNSKQYTGEISLTKTTSIRMIAHKDGYLPSEVGAFSYIINENHTLPIVALAGDPAEFFDPQTGMLANGPNYANTDSNGFHINANYYKKIEIGVSIEYFGVDGIRQLAQNAGIKVSGATSREQAQKSLLVIARNQYGDNRLHFNPFPNRDFEEYKAVVLRNTGQDYYRARMRDAVLASLMEGTGVYFQDCQPAVVYLNGEYYGHYNIRERINRYSLAQFEGITGQNAIDSVDILSGSGRTNSQIVYGSTQEYQQLVTYVKEHNMNDAAALEYVLSQVDVENLFDYFAFEIITGNSDPSNIKFYKFDTPGSKWKWIIYDMDWAFNTGSNGASYNSFDRMLKASGIGRNGTDSTIIQGLLKNKQMQKLFLERFAKLFLENFDSDTAHARIDEYKLLLAPEMEREFSRWASLEQYSRSYSSWESEVQLLHKYVDESRPYLLKYCKEWFGLSDAEMRELFGSVYDELKI